MNHKIFALSLCLLLVMQSCWIKVACGQESEEIRDVILYPIMNDTFVCAEHAEGELENLGDALGRDCLVIGIDATVDPDRRLPRLFQGNGLENEDWFGWEVPCWRREMAR